MTFVEALSKQFWDFPIIYFIVFATVLGGITTNFKITLHVKRLV